MAVSLKPAPHRRGRKKALMSEINVTPMVDVMLVLLVIFMVTAPLLTVGVPVDLPRASAPAINTPEEPLVITVDDSGTVFLQDSETGLDELGPRLAAITDNNPETRIYIRGDRKIDYGRMMEVMGTVNGAGFNHVALVAEMPTGGPAAGGSR